jgi:hypothetical protein
MCLVHLVFLGSNGNINEEKKGFNLMQETVLIVDACIHGLVLAAGQAWGGQLQHARLQPTDSGMMQPTSPFDVKPFAVLSGLLFCLTCSPRTSGADQRGHARTQHRHVEEPPGHCECLVSLLNMFQIQLHIIKADF